MDDGQHKGACCRRRDPPSAYSGLCYLPLSPDLADRKGIMGVVPLHYDIQETVFELSNGQGSIVSGITTAML